MPPLPAEVGMYATVQTEASRHANLIHAPDNGLHAGALPPGGDTSPPVPGNANGSDDETYCTGR